MNDYSPPSKNPANDLSLSGLLYHVFGKFIQVTDDMMPCKIIAFNRAQNKVTVQPLIRIVPASGEPKVRAVIVNIPVFIMGGGGFMINFNLKKDDLGWIKSNDRDISAFIQNYEEATPTTDRMHSFEDAIFIPDIMTGFSIDEDDAESMVIQSLDGTVKIALSDELITMKSPRGVEVQTVTGALRLPNMTTAQKLAIPSPQAGMMVWDTTLGSVSVYNGSTW